MNIFDLVIGEIKHSCKMILLGIAIATAIMSVVVVFYHLTGYIMPMISNQYDNNFEEGISTYIKRLDIDKVELLDELGAENIKLRTDESNQFYMSSLESDDKGVVIADKFCQWFTEEDFVAGDIPDGIAWKEFNYSENAIIYCTQKEAEKFKVGDILSLYLKNGTFVSEFKIAAVVQEDEAQGAYAVLPSAAVIQKMNEKGISISYNIECTIPKASQYINFKKSLASYGAYCSCNFDDILNLVSTLKLIFKIMAAVFVVISVFVVVTISIININTREKFLVLQKVLGSTDRKIIFIYMIILELQVIVSDIMGCFIGLKFTKHLTNVVYNLYKMEYNIENFSVVSIVLKCILISNIAVLPFLLVIKKVINRKDIIQVINNKD